MSSAAYRISRRLRDQELITRVLFVLKHLEIVPTQHRVGPYTVGELRGLFRQLVDRLQLEDA